jgi:acyl carrier protein
MEDIEIIERVKKVVSEVLGVDKDKIKLEDRFVEDLGAESVQSLELVAAFEEEFDIEMDEEKALEVKTVGKAVEFIKEYLKK